MKRIYLIVIATCLLCVGIAGAVVASESDTFSYDPNAEYVPGEILVKFAADVDEAQADTLARQYGLWELERIATENLYRMSIPASSSVWELANSIAKEQAVEYAEPNFIDRPVEAMPADGPAKTPNDTHYNDQWHYDLINLPSAWDVNDNSSAIVVAVVDTGVRFDHVDLNSRLSGNGYDFVDGDTDPTDPDNGHGTHVSGTIGAETNNAQGVAGISWSGTLLPVRGIGTHFQMAQAFRYAAGLLSAPDPVNPTPAAIINYSGGGSHSATKEAGVADTNAAGVVMACATGNDNGAVIYPAAYSTSYGMVIAVGATNYGNGSPTRAWYSNFGPSVNVVAPGGDTSVDSDGDGNVDGVLSTAWDYGGGGSQYEFWQGTSMATPHVTGVAALMLDFGIVPTSIRSILQSTATDLGAPGRDDLYGYGLINANAVFSSVSWETAYVSMFDNESDLELLRQYRNEILFDGGYPYVKVLYQSSKEALEILEGDPALMASAKRLIAKNRDAVADVLNGETGVIRDSGEIVGFLRAYAKKSPLALKILAYKVAGKLVVHRASGEPFLGFLIK